VVDFYCHEARLVVELDGSPHDEERQAEYDRVRDQELRHIGLQVLRFSNEELSADVEGVLQRIADAAGERRPSPPTPLPGGEG
jgi:very-short-patch-repair endonuclease